MKKKSFLERITGSIRFEDEKDEDDVKEDHGPARKLVMGEKNISESKDKNGKVESKWEEEEEAQLTVDLYQTQTEIIIQAMIAGVQPDNLSITITRDMITIKGKREENHSVNSENYFVQELYWGAFSRTISLPEEVDPEEAEAVEKHGLLIIRLPKINKEKKTQLKVKSI
jgi:HSP20 family protein